ncbi:hypothetical protein FH603_2674 [Spirosoma sp. LMG 31447]|uniref:Uncharacterized protein n=1 Tax=Spirosoma utsteinense TaxID=2585773 RepID=A0ABR6W6F2_9BACT|nr:hypothetical protein [Spirosoma utsteinense]
MIKQQIYILIAITYFQGVLATHKGKTLSLPQQKHTPLLN